MRRAYLGFAVFWLAASGDAAAQPLSADAICAGVRDAAVSARSNFADGARYSDGRRLLQAGDCTLSIAIGGARTLHCHWRFGYRADEANAFFERLREALTDCSGGAEPEADQQVNHPDSYDQRRFGIGGVPVTVSLKDKGALQETLVFLAVEGILPDR